MRLLAAVLGRVGEFAIFAARSFDMPLSFSASYCFSFLTFALLLGIEPSFPSSVRAGNVLGVALLLLGVRDGEPSTSSFRSSSRGCVS